MKLKVLFVDDEPHVLKGLERMLRSRRHEWEIITAASGPEALEVLKRQPVDVVVSDMRMPGMDGVQFLREVQKRYPEVVRIVLSGQSDQDMVLQSVRPAHQYLAKPCSDATLKSAIERSCGLRDLLADHTLKQLISQIDSLPSLPTLYLEIIQELESPYASIQRIGAIISQDIGMTAKILQLVNSAFFGYCRHISSPAQAVELLGLETIKALVLSIRIFSRINLSSMRILAVDRIWEHSLATGVFAKIIAAAEGQERAVIDDALMAGLLHDAGKLILAANLPGQYKKALTTCKRTGGSLLAAERQTFGVTHAEVGAYLFSLWGLPLPIVEAIAFHHHPGDCPQKELGVLSAVHAASFLELSLHQEKEAEGYLDKEYLAQLGVLPRLSAWQDLCQKALEEGQEHAV